MDDLARCSFEELGIAADLSVGIVSRIQAVYRAYQKSNFIESTSVKKAAAPQAVKEEDSAVVEAYFRANASKLIHMNEIVRATGLKKAAVAAVLAKAPWCREVDGSTYFYQQ